MKALIINLVIHKNKILNIESMDFKKYIENNIGVINSSDFSVFEVRYLDACVMKEISVDYAQSPASVNISTERRDLLQDKINIFNEILKNELLDVNKNLKIKNITDLFPDFFKMETIGSEFGIKLRKENYDSKKVKITSANDDIDGLYQQIINDNLLINMAGEHSVKKSEEIKNTVENYKNKLIKGLKNKESIYKKMNSISVGENNLYYKYIKKENRFLIMHTDIIDKVLSVYSGDVEINNDNVLIYYKLENFLKNIPKLNDTDRNKIMEELTVSYLTSKLNNNY